MPKKQDGGTHTLEPRPRGENYPKRVQSHGRLHNRPQQSSSSVTSTSREFTAVCKRQHDLHHHPSGHPRSEDINAVGYMPVDHSKSVHQPRKTSESKHGHGRTTGYDGMNVAKHDDRIENISQSKPNRLRKFRARTCVHSRQWYSQTLDGDKMLEQDRFSLPSGFVLPCSSVDNLVGIDAMELYNPWAENFNNFTCSVGQDRMWNTASTLINPFQRNSLRSLASMITCPHTVLPILVGLFTRSKLMDQTTYLQALSEEITYLRSKNSFESSVNIRRFPFCASLLPLCILLLFGYILGLTLSWQLGLAVAITAAVIYLIFCLSIFMASRIKGASSQFADTVSRYTRGCSLILNILFYRAPPPPTPSQPVKLLPISLDMAECSSAMDAMAMMTEKLWYFIENKYGKIAVRFQWACKDKFANSVQSSRKFCCLPLWLWFGVWLLSALITATLLILEGSRRTSGMMDSVQPVDDGEFQLTGLWSTMITCSVLCCSSLLVLCLKTIAPLISLFRGRPFQYASQRERMKNAGKLLELDQTRCFGLSTEKLDPDLCMNSCTYMNGNRCRSSGYRSAATIATAAGTSAAVTAAAYRQWKHLSRSGRPDELDVESQVSSQVNSTDTEVAASDSDSMGNEGEQDKEYFEQIRSNTKLFESEEFLIHNGKTKKRGAKNSEKNNPATKEAQNLKKCKELLKKGLLEAFKVLSMIDARMADRQTRIIFCITVTSGEPNSRPHALVTLATFVRLIDRLLIRQTDGRVAVEVQVPQTSNANDLTNAKESESSKQISWTPNTFVLLSSPVPYYRHLNTYPMQQNANGASFNPESLMDLRTIERQMFKHPIPWTNFRIWWSIHHLCHLPIYLEDDPPCQGVVQSESVHRSIKKEMSMHNTRLPNSACTGNDILTVFGEDHELADLNKKCLRHLTAMTAFLGRMINIDRISTEKCRLMRSPTHATLEPISSDSLITWLCLIQHWPFHTSWLTLFVEEQFKAKQTNQNTRAGDEAGNPDHPDPNADQIDWKSDLSQLHNRVLKRLGPAIEAAKKIALASSVVTSTLGPSGGDKPVATNLSHVLSTLEICDLALRDHDPRRLTEYLRPPESGRQPAGTNTDTRVIFTNYGRRLFSAGSVTTSELIRLMRLTPFLNPQVTEWMRDLSSMKSVEKTVKSSTFPKTSELPNTISQQSVLSSSYQSKARRTRTLSGGPSQTQLYSNCPVKLKSGLPSKELNQMTVSDVCRLIRDIADLSVNQKRRQPIGKGRRSQSYGASKASSSESESLINDPNPPAPINTKTRIMERKRSVKSVYEERIKQLNITGNVLSICPLDDLQKELGMSFGDWQLFAALIEYMRHVQTKTSSLREASRRHSQSPNVNDPGRSKVTDIRKTGLVKGPQGIFGTVSDTSLALTVKSAPISETKCHAHEHHHESLKYPMAKSMTEINSSYFTHHDSYSHITYCEQHRPNSEGLHRQASSGTSGRTKANILFCPRHQEEISRFLRNSQNVPHRQNKPKVANNYRLPLNKDLEANYHIRDSSAHHLRDPIHPDSLPIANNTRQSTESYYRTAPGHSGAFTNAGRFISNYKKDVHKSPIQRHYTNTTPTTSVFPAKSYRVHEGPPSHISVGLMERSVDLAYQTPPQIRETRLYSSNQSENLLEKVTGHETPGNFFVQTVVDNQIKDSSSTSLAGEMADEVADLSPTHCLTDNPNILRQEYPIHQENSEEHSDHLCNCNYWYSLEKLGTNNLIGSNSRTGDICAIHQANVSFPGKAALFDMENSSSDSTRTTKSQLDVSSGTTSRCTSTASSVEPIGH